GPRRPQAPHAESAPGVRAELNEAQAQLYVMAERQAALAQELSELGAYASSELVQSSRRDKQAEMARLDEESESLVKETRALASAANEVSLLASGQNKEATERLKSAVSQFNLTLAAYREVEDEVSTHADPSEALRKRAAAAKRHSLGS
ncbi:MAG: hypothetical protein AAF449_25205, partial [Myxococcota bacterium]